MPDKAPEAIKVAQVLARQQGVDARAGVRDRKLQTRRKIILGGILIERATRDPVVDKLMTEFIGGISREADRKAFD